MSHPFSITEQGAWCPSCGEHIAWQDEDIPEHCRTCGFPDDVEKMAEYHTGEKL